MTLQVGKTESEEKREKEQDNSWIQVREGFLRQVVGQRPEMQRQKV